MNSIRVNPVLDHVRLHRLDRGCEERLFARAQVLRGDEHVGKGVCRSLEPGDSTRVRGVKLLRYTDKTEHDCSTLIREDVEIRAPRDVEKRVEQRSLNPDYSHCARIDQIAAKRLGDEGKLSTPVWSCARTDDGNACAPQQLAKRKKREPVRSQDRRVTDRNAKMLQGRQEVPGYDVEGPGAMPPFRLFGEYP